MTRTIRFVAWGIWLAVPLAILPTTSMAQAPVPEPVTDQETELGKAVYDEERAKVEIIGSSPLYENLKPIAEKISRVAQARYPHPFKFFLVHEAQPNAFATPGGNVYVVDSLLYFARNTEELAGTLCHEVSHTIHRDAVELMKKRRHIAEGEAATAILLGPTRAQIIALLLLGELQSRGYSREAESKADVTGSDICAEAGYNPWGLVWLFQDFQNADKRHIPQFISDHPANPTRIETLKKHFAANASTFSKFDSDPKSATPFSVLKDAPVVFLRPEDKPAK
ncbi:MAG TPA: M48 family metalloprotease [Myxococcaceae bacterium]|nr:M48 family metalloprotease [Myxococcaceae bacterium]